MCLKILSQSLKYRRSFSVAFLVFVFRIGVNRDGASSMKGQIALVGVVQYATYHYVKVKIAVRRKIPDGTGVYTSPGGLKLIA